MAFVSTTAEDFLPAVFRRRKPPKWDQDTGFNPPDNILYAANTALDDPIDPNILQPPPEAGPNVALPLSGSVDMSMAPTPPVMIKRSKSGRPESTIGGDELSRNQAMSEAVDAYEPQKAKGWWGRWLKPVLTGAGLGFLRGGPGGALGGAAFNAIHSATNPRYQDESWKRRKQGELAGQARGIYAGQKENREARKTEAEITDIEARTAERGRGSKHYVERSDGVYEISDANPDGRKIANVPAEAVRAKNANPTRYFERADGVYGINDEHPDGFKVSGVPGKPLPSGEDPTEHNAAIDVNISSAEASIKKIDAKLKELADTNQRMITTSDMFGTKQVENPEWKYNKDRRDQLQDKIDAWKLQRKSAPPSTAPTKGGQPKYNIAPQYRQ